MRGMLSTVVLTTLFCGIFAMAAQAQKSETNPRVTIKTNLGEIVVELDSAAAPKTVANFLQYVRDGFYDGTVFHRVIEGFMIQGGGMSPDLARKETRAPIQNEADNGLKNDRGTIAMARTGEPHSATSQFFINTVDNIALNHSGKNPRGWGYCVFGKVVSGMETVDRIEGVQTTRKGPYQDVPAETVVIEKATLVGDGK